MSTNIRLRSVSEIVNDNFATAKIFKAHHIDFCCGGHAQLHEACRIAGADVEEIVAEIERAKEHKKGAIPFDTWPTDLLIDYVLKIHHRRIRANGPGLLELIRKVERAHGASHPELKELIELFEYSLADLEEHLQKEEQVLFPYCYNLIEAQEQGAEYQPMHCGTVANPIRVMLREHNDEGIRYKYIRNLMNDFRAPDDACNTYRLMLAELEEFMDALFEHIHIENNILFSRFVELEAACVKR